MIHCSDSKLHKKIYTVTYRAPEIENKKVSLKSDVWALGCTFFEIYYGYSYFNYRKDKRFYHLKNSEEDKLFQVEIHRELRDFKEATKVLKSINNPENLDLINLMKKLIEKKDSRVLLC